MSTLEFIAALAEALGWPLTVLVLAMVFRSALADLFSRQIKRMRAGPVEVEWERVLSETEVELDQPGVPSPIRGVVGDGLSAELAQLAEDSPAEAVFRAYRRLEEDLRHTLGSRLDPSERVGAPGLARRARAEGLIVEETVRAVEGVSVLRNLSAHTEQVSPRHAKDYLALIDAVRFALRSDA